MSKGYILFEGPWLSIKNIFGAATSFVSHAENELSLAPFTVVKPTQKSVFFFFKGSCRKKNSPALVEGGGEEETRGLYHVLHLLAVDLLT